MAKDTALLKFTVPAALIETLRAEAKQANLSLGSYLITVINARDAAKPLSATAQKAAEREAEKTRKAEREARWEAAIRDECRDLLTNGRNGRPARPDGIRVYYSELAPKDRARAEAILAEVMAELGVSE